jgi:hypothetical protein
MSSQAFKAAVAPGGQVNSLACSFGLTLAFGSVRHVRPVHSSRLSGFGLQPVIPELVAAGVSQ